MTKRKAAAKSETAAEPVKIGRPSSYTEEIADIICVRLMAGESLVSITRDEDMPAQSTVYNWLAQGGSFVEKYARARDVQADTYVDESMDIVDDGRNDWMEKFGREGESIGWQVNGEAIARSKLRVEQRRWHASKLAPKKYGDKLDLNHSGQVGVTVKAEELSDDELAARIAGK